MSGRGAGSVQSLTPLRAELARCFTDVARGDRFTGVSTGPDTARFYYNGAHRCDVRWPGFRRHFFGIWLAGRDGPAAEISARLRGERSSRHCSTTTRPFTRNRRGEEIGAVPGG